MTVKVTWQPSADPSIYSYLLQSSPDATTWTLLDTIIDAPRTGANPHYDTVNAVFFYNDAAGSASTWYRLAAVDTLAQQSAWSAAFQPTGGLVPPWETVQQIVSNAALDLGLGNAGTNVMASSDANILQLCSLLKSAGRELVHLRSWNHLRGEHSFTTAAGQSVYPLPADYHNMIDQTWWNRTNRLPVGGPLSAQEWQYLKGRIVGVVFNVLFRPMNRQIVLYPDNNIPTGFNIVFEYNSSFWISTSGTPDTATSDAPAASTDFVWFDPLLMVRKLKLDFLKAKGFDTTSAQQDYETALEYVKGNDAPSPVLNATRRFNPVIDPLIGGQNIPVTGFGS